MIIRKLFKFEGSHVVRNCTTDRCSKTVHGHSYLVEVFLEAGKVDNGGMILDFSLLKREVKDIIDSFDHTLVMWNKESSEFKRDMYKYSERVIELPMTSSAECLSIQLFFLIDKIIKNTEFKNSEDPGIHIHSIRVHETTTGYAEAFRTDIPELSLDDFKFTEAIIKDWTNTKMIEDLKQSNKFINPEPFRQV